MSSWQVIEGECIAAMKEMDDASVDAIVTDPPYGLGFMGKAWDALPPGQPWAEQCLRVLKPGGHLLAFGGTRTYHRLAVAIEDAGFEIRDTLAWMYGSGFPKSLDVGKAIDRAAGANREVIGTKLGLPGYSLAEGPDNSILGRGIGGSGDPAREAQITAPATPEATAWEGWGTALKPAFEPIVVARKPLVGTVAANVLAHGTGAMNIDASRIGTTGGGNACPGGDACTCDTDGRSFSPTKHPVRREGDFGRWPANVVLDEAAAAMLDQQSGTLTSGAEGSEGHRRNADHLRMAYGDFAGTEAERGVPYGDSGGASRFFYVAKPSRAERNAGLEGFAVQRVHGMDSQPNGSTERPTANVHPTVKPIAVMEWLIRLVTPPGGVVLDPFTGSGTTGIAATRLGFTFIGIEREAEYAAIARARIIGDAPLFNSAGEVAA
jgi:site-specific DNA-methyltransferase (adenine-specific)